MNELYDGKQVAGGGRVDMVDGKPIIFIPLTKSLEAWSYRQPTSILDKSIELELPQEMIEGDK
jgi:hypothetical protein